MYRISVLFTIIKLYWLSATFTQNLVGIAYCKKLHKTKNRRWINNGDFFRPKIPESKAKTESLD